MSNKLAAVFFSHCTLILIWLCWVVLFRGLRNDLLRTRLGALQIELDRLPRSEEHARLSRRISGSLRSAEFFTLTRFFFCLLLGQVRPSPSLPGTSALVALEERLRALTADHLTGGLPLLSPFLKKDSGWLDVILESCPDSWLFNTSPRGVAES
jgi:hypothetical protein